MNYQKQQNKKLQQSARFMFKQDQLSVDCQTTVTLEFHSSAELLVA